MSARKGLTNIGASVRQRLLDLSRKQRVDFGGLLSNYVLERFLYRLSCSAHKDRFVLKGAMLFRIWSDEPHRATRDLDLLALETPEAVDIGRLFLDICNAAVEDDGVEFQADAMRTHNIREDQEFGGVRVRLRALIAGARIPLQIDVGFGDAVTPPAEVVPYPTILGFPAPVIRAYPREAVIAEKFHAMVALGIANSRMKDFYDIYSLATTYEFTGASISSAITSTFGRRAIAIPSDAPLALTSEFSEDPLKTTQWHAFISGGNVSLTSLVLTEVVHLLGLFLVPPARAASLGGQFDATWVAPGPWI